MQTEIKRKISVVTFQLVAIFLFGLVVYAQEESKVAVSKEADSTQETSLPQKTYEDNLKRWQGLSEEERQVIRDRAKSLQPGQIEELREESVKFRSIPREEQDRIKVNYQKFNKLSPEEKEILKERHQHFERLPLEKKEELRSQFREKRVVPSDIQKTKSKLPEELPIKYATPNLKIEGPLIERGLANPKDIKKDKTDITRDNADVQKDKQDITEDKTYTGNHKQDISKDKADIKPGYNNKHKLGVVGTSYRIKPPHKVLHRKKMD